MKKHEMIDRIEAMWNFLEMDAVACETFWNAVRHHYATGKPLPPLPVEQYDAGFFFDRVKSIRTYLNLPDKTRLQLVEGCAYEKMSLELPSQPHTLTPVKEYTVGRFYHLGSNKNDCWNYALCVSLNTEPTLVKPVNISGIIEIRVIAASHDDKDILEVTPI